MKIFCNGSFCDAEAPLFTAGNRGFRYGDGLFETIKVKQGQPLLWKYHMERLLHGLGVLQMGQGTVEPARLLADVQELCRLNGCWASARLRLAVYREDTGSASYVLQAEPLGPEAFHLNETGWRLTVFGGVQKQRDMLSNLKTANYLPYLMAARHAAAEGCDESLVCNPSGRICDGSRTNIFLVRGGQLLTPALSEGCVGGVMRRYLLEQLPQLGIACAETAIDPALLLEADEIFLTNAIQGIRWVSHYRQKAYGQTLSSRLFREVLATIQG